MDLNQYQELAARTDVLPQGLEGTRLALLGLVGEAGSAASAAKKDHRDRPRDGLAAALSAELGDLLWYAAAVARRQGLQLGSIAQQNLEKAADLFGEPSLPRLFDIGYQEEEQLPRMLRVRFVVDTTSEPIRCRMIAEDDTLRRIVEQRWAQWGRQPDITGQIGDPIDDNSEIPDNYRYHDVIHLAHAAILGWSPVVRSLLGRKRTSRPAVDRVQDGARAIAIEEGLAAIVFRQLELLEFSDEAVPFDLVSQVRWYVRGHEVADVAPSAWLATYKAAARVLKQLIDQGGGIIEANLNHRTLESRPR